VEHWHAPPEHVPFPQEIPHAPQFAASVAYVAGSVHTPAQTTCPSGQGGSSTPPHPVHLERSTAAARRMRVRKERAMTAMIRRASGR
jgi:adenylosuccinate lyase